MTKTPQDKSPQDSSHSPAAAPGEDPLSPAWERRFMTGRWQVNEAVELYRKLGYEVRVEPVTREELGDECDDCALALALYVVVYTRKKQEGTKKDS